MNLTPTGVSVAQLCRPGDKPDRRLANILVYRDGLTAGQGRVEGAAEAFVVGRDRRHEFCPSASLG